MKISDASLKKDYALTIIVQFVVLASGLLVYKLAAEFFGTDGFSGYALSRRTISLIQPALLMGLGVGIPRYIAYGCAKPDQKNPDAYFISALFILVPVFFIFFIFFNLFNGTFSYIFFGSSDYSYLILPITCMIIGQIFHASCYSYFRGRLMMMRANLLQAINMGIIPPATFFLFGKSLSTVLAVTGIVWIIISSLAFLFMPIKLGACNPRKLVPYAKEIMGYSIMRVPGDFALSALLALPAILTAHMTGVREAGFVAFGTVVFNMGGYFFAPISTILLPKASHMIARANYEGLKYDLKRMLMSAICLTTLGVVILEIFTSQLIEIYLKKNFFETIMIVRVFAIGIVPYVVYIVLRSIIDANYVKPINVINMIVSLLFFITGVLLIVLFKMNYIYIVGIFVISIYVLGMLSLFVTRTIFRRKSYCQSS